MQLEHDAGANYYACRYAMAIGFFSCSFKFTVSRGQACLQLSGHLGLAKNISRVTLYIVQGNMNNAECGWVLLRGSGTRSGSHPTKYGRGLGSTRIFSASSCVFVATHTALPNSHRL